MNCPICGAIDHPGLPCKITASVSLNEPAAIIGSTLPPQYLQNLQDLYGDSRD